MSTSGQPPPVEVRGLVKRYGELAAVAGVDLTVEAGDVYGYLGPNGAGKTTSLRMMLGLIRPTEGSVRLFGRDAQWMGRRVDSRAFREESGGNTTTIELRREELRRRRFPGSDQPFDKDDSCRKHCNNILYSIWMISR